LVSTVIGRLVTHQPGLRLVADTAAALAPRAHVLRPRIKHLAAGGRQVRAVELDRIQIRIVSLGDRRPRDAGEGRLAFAGPPGSAYRRNGVAEDARGGAVERTARHVGLDPREPLSDGQIAAAVGLQSNYATQLGNHRCGMTVWECLTRLRIGHAQRLLLTTGWKMHRVARDSGFGSVSRFYEAFHRFGGGTPRHYRATMAPEQGPSHGADRMAR
jgi:AraC-like DNA-binding protein